MPEEFNTFSNDFCQIICISHFFVVLLRRKTQKDTKKGQIMLGFSSSRGEVVKGKFAEELRATMLRAQSGNLNAEDKARIAFEKQC